MSENKGIIKMNIIKKIALLGIGIALYFVLSLTVKIPLISHIQTDLGYIVFGAFLYMLGPIAFIVGAIGCLFESLLISGWIPIGWIVGQILIGIVCGFAYKKIKNVPINILITVAAVFIGVGIIKTGFECVLYQIPVIVKFPKNAIAFVADCVPMIIGYLIARKLPRNIYEGDVYGKDI